MSRGSEGTLSTCSSSSSGLPAEPDMDSPGGAYQRPCALFSKCELLAFVFFKTELQIEGMVQTGDDLCTLKIFKILKKKKKKKGRNMGITLVQNASEKHGMVVMHADMFCWKINDIFVTSST